ncbi:MAG: tryptophan--tRNA ligase [Bdellovibrionales bacterium]|nr:tryptophan--tRNA ligase [Bdellovibrionales bacterium]
MKIFSGMRPTGKLHLGHLLGALSNWTDLQNKNHECYFCVADLHALTSDFSHTEHLRSNIHDMVVDWLAAGLDPEKCHIFVQSHVKEQSELFLLLGMITPMGWLERNPTYKELRNETTEKDLSNLGFFSYPVMQAADILIVKAEGVPVGQDQVPHLEITREIVRRFNYLYGKTFPEPKALLTAFPKIMGTDGRKMSKSYNNSILLSDSDKDVQKKIQGMVTDPKRARRQDPGDPDTCNLFPLHQIFSSNETIKDVRNGCTTAVIGCVDCKKILLPNLEKTLAPIREKRIQITNDPAFIQDVLDQGAKQTREQSQSTLEDVRKAMHL